MMLTLEKECIKIIHYQQKLSLRVRSDAKKTESFIFTVVPQTTQVSNVKKNKRDVSRTC